MEDSGRVALELLDLGHGGIPPKYELIFTESMGRTNLSLILGPKQGADLRPGVN